MQADTNLKYLKRSTKTPRAGDVFVMLPPDGKYLFGRVIGAALPDEQAPMPKSNLVYIYAFRSDSKDPDIDALTPGSLLIPPLFTNKTGWTKGVFETVRNTPLGTDDLLRQHCFWRAAAESYIDWARQPLETPFEPCGSWGLQSYRMIDDHISDALGIERVPEK